MAESYTSGVVQTRHGMWFKHGDMAMNLLDGYRSVLSTHPHAIGQIRGTPDGTLWQWTGSALQRYSSGSWTSYSLPEVTTLGTSRNDTTQNWQFVSNQIPSLSVTLGLAPLSRDRVLLLLPDRILEFDVRRGTAVPILLVQQTNLNRFLEIRLRNSGGTWVSGNNGLGILSQAQDGGWNWSGYASRPAGFSDFKELVEGENGDLWVVAKGQRRKSLLRFSGGLWRTVYSSESAILRGWPGADGSVWVQDGNQMVELTGGVAHPVEKLNALSGIVLSAQPEKGNAKFWVATSQGVARYSPPPWRTPPGLRQLDELVSAITEDRNGRLWFASASSLICFDNQRWKTFSLPKGQQTWAVYTESLAALPDGKIVLRTTSPNPLTFDPRTERFGTLEYPEGRDIRLFVSHPEGLVVQTISQANDRSTFRLEIYNGRTFRTILDNGVVEGGDDLRTIRLDRSGDVWTGSITEFGVHRNGRFERQGPAQGFTDSGCFLIYQAPSGTVYAGGRESLFVRDGNSWRMIHTGLDRARSIVAAHDGTLWVASGTGVHRYRDGNWLSNGAEEGLPSNVAYRVFEDSRGRIWAGTTRGISLYHPDADLEPPTTFISDEQNSHEAPADGQVRLVFSGTDKWKQTPSGRLLFSWRLDGGPWSPFSPTRSASFKHLSAGRRLFEVRAMDRNGNVDPSPAAFEFSVPPPWYRNSAFQVVAGLSLAAIATLLSLAILSYRQRGRLIVELHQKKRLESDRQAILEMVAHRRPLLRIFRRITRSIAVNCPGTLAGVIRLNNGIPEAMTGSALPAGFTHDLEAIHADPADFDDIWTQLHLAASRHALSGCHFAPIRSGGEELLGAIAVFLRPESANAGASHRLRRSAEISIVSTMSNLAGAAIDSARLYERLAYQAEHDALTGLPNRLMFEFRLVDALAVARQTGRSLAVFFLDLDRFKQINDSLGHRVGDLFLKQVAGRLSSAVPRGATLARIGGDEFTLLLLQRDEPDWVEQMTNQLLQSLRTPCVVEGHQLFASASIGISLYPRDGDDPATLQKNADAAMYRAKASGRNRYSFFSPEMAPSTAITIEMEPVLRSGLEHGRFELHYQPQFTMDGQLAGIEALLRLNHPVLGLIAPDQFMSLADETGLIIPIGEWVCQEACSQVQRWRQQGCPVPKVAVNVSAVQFRQADFAHSIARVLRKLAFEPNLLELELTESAIMSDLSESNGQLQKLRSLGVRVAVDHFGADHSTLTSLHRLPVNALTALKIDRSFTDGLDAALSTLPLVQAIVVMAQNLGLAVAATGIERPRQFSMLRGIHSGTVQGYLFARPQPAREIEQLMRSIDSPWLKSAIEAASMV
jgi:diguanylate cyclase (GGDEF)-like protein